MNFIRFNRPVPANPLTSALDEFFHKGLSELSGSNFSFNKPSVNIIEEDDTFQVQLAAPGLKKEDFEIKIDKDQLIVKVSQKQEVEKSEGEKDDGPKYRRREFNYNAFSRSFHLPETINSDEIAAAYEDGVLKITLHKKEEAKEKEPRMIAIS